MTSLTQLLLDAGLIQFGWFHRDGEMLPFTLHLDMIASYPVVLKQVVAEAQDKIGAIDTNRLLCTADAIPFGVAFSQQTGISLVYSKGSAEAPVFDLIGAYDIGHPTLLLTNSVGWEQPPTQLLSGAQRVGLEVHTLLTIVEARSATIDGVSILPLLRLVNVVTELSNARQIPPQHAAAVLQWLNS